VTEYRPPVSFPRYRYDQKLVNFNNFGYYPLKLSIENCPISNGNDYEALKYFILSRAEKRHNNKINSEVKTAKESIQHAIWLNIELEGQLFKCRPQITMVQQRTNIISIYCSLYANLLAFVPLG
jgi:hypothetical protein